MRNKIFILLKKLFITCSDLFVALGMTLLIILLLFFSNFFVTDFQKIFLGSNSLFVLIMLLILVFFIKINNKFTFNISFDKVNKYLIVIFFLIQIYLFYNIFFETGWDVRGIRNIAITSISGGAVDNSYFANYPNNMLLTSITAIILKINNSFGVFTGEYSGFCLVFVNCLISSYASYLVYSIIRKLINKSYAFLGYLIFVALIILSPWNVIFYSDSLGLLFPISIIYIYVNFKTNNLLKYMFIVILGYLGYLIKPQCIIIVISIALCICINNIDRINKCYIKKIFLLSICSIGLLCGINNGITALNKSFGFEKNDNLKFGMSHFLMMGLNSEYSGVYSEEDVVFSASYKTSSARTKANLEVVKKRINQLGLAGFLHLMCDKAMINFNDGTFAWGIEGGFYSELKDDINTKTSPFLKKVYYTNDGVSANDSFKYFATFTQFFWINILFLIFYKSIKQFLKKKKKFDSNYQIIIIALLGLTIFEQLFEARARYFYAYVPLFIIIAMFGLSELVCDLKRIIKLDLRNR